PRKPAVRSRQRLSDDRLLASIPALPPPISPSSPRSLWPHRDGLATVPPLTSSPSVPDLLAAPPRFRPAARGSYLPLPTSRLLPRAPAIPRCVSGDRRRLTERGRKGRAYPPPSLPPRCSLRTGTAAGHCAQTSPACRR